MGRCKKIFLAICVCLIPLISLHSAEIAIVSLAAGKEFQETVQLGLQNKQSYCAQHGYDFICGEESLDSTRGITWSKILLILKTMENNEYKWIFWTDADALIMNTALYIEDLIDENYNLIINYDFNGFNSGHFLIRNCDWSRQFLKDAYTHEEFINDPEWEQGAMLAALQQNTKYSAATKIVPQRLMNSFPDQGGSFLQSTYLPGDFVLHFAGVRKLSLLNTCFEYYYPLIRDQAETLTYEHYLGIHGITKLPKQSFLFNWSTETQNKQYEEELAKHPEIRTVAQVGLSDGILAEVFFKNCPNLTQCTAFVSKRYDPFCRAACDYLSRKYRSLWKESSERPKNITPIAAPVDLLHIQTRSLRTFEDILNRSRGLADTHTLVWINDYNLPEVQKIVARAVENDLLEIIAVHISEDSEGSRAWIEAHYKFL